MTIKRVGNCKACGFCCGFENGKITEGSCIHLTENGLCRIYDKRDQYCVICGKDHKDCIEGPRLPIKYLNKNCGYSFIIYPENTTVQRIELG